MGSVACFGRTTGCVLHLGSGLVAVLCTLLSAGGTRRGGCVRGVSWCLGVRRAGCIDGVSRGRGVHCRGAGWWGGVRGGGVRTPAPIPPIANTPNAAAASLLLRAMFDPSHSERPVWLLCHEHSPHTPVEPLRDPESRPRNRRRGVLVGAVVRASRRRAWTVARLSTTRSASPPADTTTNPSYASEKLCRATIMVRCATPGHDPHRTGAELVIQLLSHLRHDYS